MARLRRIRGALAGVRGAQRGKRMASLGRRVLEPVDNSGNLLGLNIRELLVTQRRQE